MTQSLSLAVVGLGKLGLVHCALANSLPGCRLVAVAEPQSIVNSLLRAQLSDVTLVTDYRELLTLKLDGVFIASPNHLHVPISLDFIRAGVPVFIEKPLAIHSQQALPLLSELKRKSVLNMVGYMSRYIETFAKAQQIVSSGALGRLQTFKATMYIGQLFQAGKGWRYEKETSGGGVLITQNSHLIDMLRWLFGEVEWVNGHTRALYSREVEDCVHAHLEFSSGLTGWMDTSWSARHHRTLTMNISVQGERGTLDVNDDEVRLFLDKETSAFAKDWSVFKKPDLFSGVSVDIGGPHYTKQTEAFVNAIRGQGQIGSDIHSAFAVQTIVDAIYQSASERGRPVAVPHGALA